MPTNLEEIDTHLGTESEEVVFILLPRFALEVARGRYHQHYYELPNIADSAVRDRLEALLDAGETGMADVLLMGDLLARLDTMNGHLQEMATQSTQIATALYTADDVAIADVLEGVGGGAWDDIEITDLINNVGLIATALG